MSTKVRKTFLMSEGLIAQINELEDKLNVNSETAVVAFAIGELYRKTFKDYVINRANSAAKTPEEKAETQDRIQTIRKQKEEDALLAIADALGGKVVNNDGGSKTVHYYTYDKNSRYLQELPLSMMTEELVDNQYFPSREEVEKRQKEKKVNYDPKSWN